MFSHLVFLLYRDTGAAQTEANPQEATEPSQEDQEVEAEDDGEEPSITAEIFPI